MSDRVEPESPRFSAYPPGDWRPRGPPTGPEIEVALSTAREWWPWAAGPRGDETLEGFVDLFERYLAGEVELRMASSKIERESVQTELVS